MKYISWSRVERTLVESHRTTNRTLPPEKLHANQRAESDSRLSGSAARKMNLPNICDVPAQSWTRPTTFGLFQLKPADSDEIFTQTISPFL
ncbi:hypothetical protein JTB14_028684 [Gonioctena quinquepunctata]|nr:hypothetical protein JTB14_028684 [Gonioctena quinquepunctata]